MGCRRDIIGILWPVRALLHIANIEYDYIEVRFTEWVGLDWSGTQVGDKLKKLFRNQHVPRYVDSEVDINQSLVMWAARSCQLIRPIGAEGLD